MAGTKYSYVKSYELPDTLLPGTFIVLRLDGHAFHRFSQEHNFAKPNDERALQLMDHAARGVMDQFKDIVLAFGESDEYSFLFRKSTAIYNRRQAKILTNATSLFTSSYIFHWPTYFPDTQLKFPPTFDGRIVLYPSEREVRDYFAWRQADTHINNLYNTVFWALVQQGGETTTQAHATLRGSDSKVKHEILFSRFRTNYSTIPERFRKGSVLVREQVPTTMMHGTSNVHALAVGDTAKVSPDLPQAQASLSLLGGGKRKKISTEIVLLHCDVIQRDFWETRPYLLDE